MKIKRNRVRSVDSKWGGWLDVWGDGGGALGPSRSSNGGRGRVGKKNCSCLPGRRAALNRRGGTGMETGTSWVGCRLGGRANRHGGRHRPGRGPAGRPSHPARGTAQAGCEAGRATERTGTQAGICRVPCRFEQIFFLKLKS